MPIFKATDPAIVVVGALLLPFINHAEYGLEHRKRVLEENGIEEVSETTAHSFQSVLDIMEDLEEEVGERAMWQTGVTTVALLPPFSNPSAMPSSMTNAFEALDHVVKFAHNNGGCGGYKVVEENPEENHIVFEVSVPYSTAFILGNVVGMARAITGKFEIATELIDQSTEDNRFRKFKVSW